MILELDKVYKLAVCVEGRNISGSLRGKKVLDARIVSMLVGELGQFFSMEA